MIDIASLREAFERERIKELGWLRSGQNLADPLTNRSKSAKLGSLPEDRKLVLDVAQWVVWSTNGHRASVMGTLPLSLTLSARSI